MNHSFKIWLSLFFTLIYIKSFYQKSGSAPGFSDETLSYLERLEAKYFRE